MDGPTESITALISTANSDEPKRMLAVPAQRKRKHIVKAPTKAATALSTVKFPLPLLPTPVFVLLKPTLATK